ncbi:hypothetical protein OS493_005230 [Desmophyllum pertusum]|uniref:Roadblock/LAMTOR2 domain-containing protein n=1 Tax=Desmophyllum pertusum TaxID=174260 RepID=A0A9X0CSX6_9CNID|nr:hypothetical protein OS493_005230 [Desmophyllum pertusum]
MSHLGKLKPSHLYIYDRLSQDKRESDAESKDGMLDEHHPSAELSQDYKIHLKDDGLGKYKISPLGCLNDPTEAETTRGGAVRTTNGEKKSTNSVTKKKSEVEEALKRIQSHKGVIGIIVVNQEGIPIRTTLDNSTTVQYAGLIHQLTAKARSTVRDIDAQNDLTFLRIRSKKHEIMVAPGKFYIFITV